MMNQIHFSEMTPKEASLLLKIIVVEVYIGIIALTFLAIDKYTGLFG
jgi:hypothetical protein